MEKQFVKFNINHHVYVKLTDSGILKYIKAHNQYSKKDPLTIVEFSKRADKDGYFQFQMHEFMEIFGDDVISFTHFDSDIYFDKSELNIPSNPQEVKAIEGWEGRSADDVDLPDGYYEGKWGGYEVNLEHIKIKGRASTHKFKTTEGIRCIDCAVKVIIKNKRAYIYDHKTNLYEEKVSV
jgi:DNA-directed RNA polymerase subunit RPC12/RpoP